ncbi:hypothetical protein V8C34DRAFT_301920 [Trichoderma compactum]
MANMIKEDGIHVDETTDSRVLAFSRFDIGNHYRRESSSFGTLTKVVENVTNRAMDCPREWEAHCRPLDKLYGDAQHTIRAVAEVIVAWCSAIIGLVADESNWKWKNEMIRKVDKAGGKIRLKIKTYQVVPPSVAWSEEDQCFVLSIPEHNIMGTSGLVPQFKQELLYTLQIPLIPDVEKMKAPRELLLRPPYYLSIQATSQTCIIVQSSHSPSLEFLAKYLRKNCRRSHKHLFAIKYIFKTKGPSVIDIELKQNPFTPKSESSGIYDTLTLKAGLSSGSFVNRISPSILTRLVKNELGYELQSSDQNNWYYRREEPLKEPLEEPLEVVYR